MKIRKQVASSENPEVFVGGTYSTVPSHYLRGEGYAHILSLWNVTEYRTSVVGKRFDTDFKNDLKSEIYWITEKADVP